MEIVSQRAQQLHEHFWLAEKLYSGQHDPIERLPVRERVAAFEEIQRFLKSSSQTVSPVDIYSVTQ